MFVDHTLVHFHSSREPVRIEIGEYFLSTESDVAESMPGNGPGKIKEGKGKKAKSKRREVWGVNHLTFSILTPLLAYITNPSNRSCQKDNQASLQNYMHLSFLLIDKRDL